ncbi:hypothetical protein Aph01nite_16920 [Acrocarpospora phusangensis]|uniref:Uncharacterized protein n=1 Tax=Acrocarpospora phusangensis TaxID=1070424 RepID=A0A919QBN5_9ACTN|nr:DUF5984 family protein [Acrocarpospora phusangensis]GIH23382.1 hypothetical protein Aph01nite_16920 [Acrocarpospora phusangensis]
MIEFRFALTPLGQVSPWGDEVRRLHWFGLTDGWYWIELDGHELLRYSPETLQRYRTDQLPAQRPYVDYYLARLWEDITDMTPTVLQPVPKDLLGFVAGDPDTWQPVESDTASIAAGWHDEHRLDLGYIRQPPRIRAWRTSSDDLDTVTVTWRHDDEGSIRFTADPTGRVVVPAESFLTAVRRLDHDLMIAMERRIRVLERTGPPDGVQLDLRALRAEHLDRTTWLARRLQREPATDWAAVRAGAAELLGVCSGS